MHDTEQTVAALTVFQVLQVEPVWRTHVFSCSVCQLSCGTAEQTVVTVLLTGQHDAAIYEQHPRLAQNSTMCDQIITEWHSM